jgi:hypothetical protein
MTYVHVKMDQGAVLPRPSSAYDGISTHGIDTCTGLAIVSEKHVFLAHISPPVQDEHVRGGTINNSAETMIAQDAWYNKMRNIIFDALSSMGGKIQQIVIVSNAGEVQDRQISGAILIKDRFDIYFKGVINGCVPEQRHGKAVRVEARTGSVKEQSGSYKQGDCSEFDARDGDDVLVFMN